MLNIMEVPAFIMRTPTILIHVYSDGLKGEPCLLYQLPTSGPLAIKIWAVLLYHGHIVRLIYSLMCVSIFCLSSLSDCLYI